MIIITIAVMLCFVLFWFFFGVFLFCFASPGTLGFSVCDAGRRIKFTRRKSLSILQTLLAFKF